MRFRLQPLAAFALLLVVSAYLGLTPSKIPNYGHSDKLLHFITFGLLTICFYWIFDTNKLKNLQITIAVCTLGLGIGSEIVQGILPNQRVFDILDIGANIAGSATGIGLCMWYSGYRKRKVLGLMDSSGDGADVEHGQRTGLIPTNHELGDWENTSQDWNDDDPTITEASIEEAAPPVKERSD